MIIKDDFIGLLEDYLLTEEAKELEINLTGDEAEDAPLIDSPQKANYFLKLIASIQGDIDNINQVCDEEIAKTVNRVNHFRESQIVSLTKQIAYYERMLQNYTEAEIANSKKKSVKLPYGVLSVKKQQPKWEYNDDELMEWAKKYAPELIKTDVKETVIKNDLKKAVEKDGELVKYNNTTVPGIVLIEQPDKFSVKINK